MKKIDFRGKYGSAGSKKVYIARIQNALGLGSEEQSLIDLIKASFGGDRSAAGRYAAEQRWKGNRKKDKPKGKKRVSAVERTKEQKMSDGPILVNGRDKFGFPKLLSVADGEKKFGKTPEEIKEYFKKRGLTINLEPETKILVQPPELYAALQGVDDVLNAIKTESKEGFTVVAGTNQPLPEVTIQYITPSSEGAVGGDFTQMGENSWRVPNINLYAGMMTVYGKIIGESPGSTIPQLSASTRERLSKTGEFSQAVTYGFAVHEFGHFVDYAMRRGGVMSFWSMDMKNALRMREAVGENSRMRTEILEGLSDDFKTKGKLFSEVGGRAPAGLENEPGMKYSSTNTLEKFAETFTSWFLLSQAKSVWVDRAKANLQARGSDFVIEKITDVVKQATIKDNLMEFPPDHPIFLFAFGRMQDTDATVSKSLIDLLKASFGGDRSAAGRYAANMRWKGQGQREQEQVGLDRYPKINNDLEELFINTPILNSGLGKTMEEINKEIRERERESQTEDEILPMVIFSSYLGKGSNEFYGALNRHLRRGNPLEDWLREKLSEEDEERVERLEREIRQLERDQDEDDDTDNSAEIESLRNEVDEIEEQVNDAERISAEDWNYDEHSESDFDSQYGSIPISINGEDVKMPKVVAYGLMDDAFRELSMVMPSNLRVYRGIDPETITSLEASVGKTVEDLGFCSTSTDPNKAIAFSGVGVPMQSQLQTEYYKEGDTLSSDKRIATILIPKGLKVVMPNRGGEGEVILNRGTQFKVVGVNEMGPILEVIANDENK